MRCPNCGKEFSESYAVCPGCGWAVSIPGPAADEAPETPALDESLEAVPAEVPTQDETPETDETPEAVPAAPTQYDAPPAADETPEAVPAEAPTQHDAPEMDEAPEADASEAGDPDEARSANPEDAGTETDDAPSADGDEPSAEGESSDGDNAPEETPPKPKKRPVAAIALFAVAGLLLITIVCVSIFRTSTGKTSSGSSGLLDALSGYDAEAAAIELQDADGSVVSTLNNEQLSFYYWGEFYYFAQSNGSQFDLSVPLDQQNYSDEQTWQDYFLENACNSIQQTEALKAEAQKAGFTMPETYQTEYDSTIASMPDYAAQAGFTTEDGSGDVLAYVQDSYGPAATVETFAQYLYDSYFVTAYSDTLYDSQTVTDEELSAYYDEHAEELSSYGIEKSDTPNVNVRHILIQPAELDEDATEEDEQAAWSDAEAEAQRIYEAWQSGEATEDSFAEAANTYSTDPGSNTGGGLYESVYPGQMVAEFNDWCFDPERKPGDTGIVRTSYGYHIMYFVGATEEYYWKTTVEGQLRFEKYQEALSALMAQYHAVPTDQLEIVQPDAVIALQTNHTQADSAAEPDSAAKG